jgi:hypothetical protein
MGDSCGRDPGSASAAGDMKIECRRRAFFHAETIVKAEALVEAEISRQPACRRAADRCMAKLLIRTVRDMLRFWGRWVLRGQALAARS